MAGYSDFDRQLAEIMANPGMSPEQKRSAVQGIGGQSPSYEQIINGLAGPQGPTPGLPSSAALTAMNPATRASALPQSAMNAPPQQSPEAYTGPLVGLGAPPQAQRPPPSGPGDFGLGSAQRGIRAATDRYQGTAEDIYGKQNDLLRQRGDTMGREQDMVMRRSADEAVVLENRFSKMQELQQREAETEKQRQEQVGRDFETLNASRENLRYFNMDPTARDKAQAVLKDPTATDEERAQASDTLDKGSKIDPGRLLGNTRNKVFAAIATGLGAYGAALTGSANTAAEMVQQAIDNDINAQRAAQEARREELGAANDLIAQNRQRFEDERQAMLATKIQMLELSQLEVERAQARYGGEESAINLEKMHQDLGQAVIETEAKFNEASVNNAIRGRSAEADIAARRAQLAAMQAKNERSGIPAIPGMRPTGEKLPTKQDIKDVTTGREATVKALQELDKMEAHINKYGREMSSMTDASKEGKRMARSFQLMLKSPLFFQLGVLAGPDVELLDETFPNDINKLRQDDVRNAIHFWRDKITDGWAASARQRGYADEEIGSSFNAQRIQGMEQGRAQ